MSSPYHQIALECRPLRIDEAELGRLPPPLASLRLGLAMLFAGIMLTLGVTLSLTSTSELRAATVSGPLVQPSIQPIVQPIVQPTVERFIPHR